jgi:CO/xanthine dehydrogenase Mo-binding subunit
VDVLEIPDPTGPFGAKGAAEHTTKDLAPAIVHAIHDAVSVWIDSLPATPERVWRALRQAAPRRTETNREPAWTTSKLGA